MSEEDLLRQIEFEFKNKQSAKVDKKEPAEGLLSQIESKFQRRKTVLEPSKIDSEIDNLADQFKLKTKPKEEINHNTFEEIKRQELEQQRKAKAEAKKREELTHKAQSWLKNLNPNSDEGFWFSQFAMSYNSKLEAAIDYLQALE